MPQGPRTLRLHLEYDGTGFYGWACQPGLRTVQGTLQAAIGKVFEEHDGLAVAGRTDTGVHASGQVVSLSTTGGPPTDRVAVALNQHLPRDIAVTGCAETDAGFHARFAALWRAYDYRVLPGPIRSALRATRAWHVPGRVDWDVVAACAALVVGEHDFRAFTPAETQHHVFRRTVLEAAWRAADDELVLRIAADSFLRHMVRTLVGTMVETGRGGRSVDEFRALLDGAERTQAGATAPACGLCLVEVRYPG